MNSISLARSWAALFVATVLLPACDSADPDGDGGEQGPAFLTVTIEGPASIVAGEEAAYELIVRNTGDDAREVQLSLTLPEQLEVDMISDGGSVAGTVVTWSPLDEMSGG
jgi:hypothetical protein